MDSIIKNSFVKTAKLFLFTAIIDCSRAGAYLCCIPTYSLHHTTLLTFTEKCHIGESFRIEETLEGGEEVCFITVPPSRERGKDLSRV